MTPCSPSPPLVTGTWDVLYPRPEGRWPGYAQGGDVRVYGLYDPVTGVFETVRPEEDAALPALAHWLRRGELLAYRPGRRAMVFTGDGTYAKVLRPRRAAPLLARIAAAEEAARRAGPGFPDLAHLVGVEPDGVLRFAPLPGRSLHDVLVGTATGRDAVPAVLDRVGAALARFQSAPAASVAGGPRTTAQEPATWTALAVRDAPELAGRYGEVLAGLPPAPPEGVTVVAHGDLHDRNVVVGAGVGFLDLDLLGWGGAAEDPGNLAAHLVLRALQCGVHVERGRRSAARLIDGYIRHGGVATPSAVMAVGARTLFRLACLYRFRRRWRPLVPALLDEAARWTSPATLIRSEENVCHPSE